MTCADFKDNVHALALGALPPDELRACEAHLAGEGPHAGCEEEWEKACEAAALIGLALEPLAPPEDVWRAIERRVAAAKVRELSPPPAPRAGRPAGVARRASGRWREVAAWTLAAAAGAALFFELTARRRALDQAVAVGEQLAAARAQVATVSQQLASANQRAGDQERSARDAEEQRQICVRELESVRDNVTVQQAALSLIQNPRTQLVQLAAQGGAPYRASAILNPSEKRAMLLASALSEQPGKSYELWVIRGKEKIPAGLLRRNAAGQAIAPISDNLLAPGAPDALAVTIEPQGGSPQPTGPIVLLGTVPKT